MDKKTYYITTPIYYPSDNLHIGHAYTTVAADAEARYRRLKGYDVMFLTGTDEHGQKIQRKADKKGVTPQKYVDDIVANIKNLWKILDVTNDRFIRTTDDYHVAAVQKIFKQLYDQGDIYKSEYEGWYCTPCESFWTETQVKDGCCPDCGGKVEKMKEESYFFKLSKYQDRLIDYIESHPDFIQPVSRKNEMLNNFLRPGLEDLCVSRTSFNWGIPVTFDEKHVVYVWIDALSNYITALGYGSEDKSAYEKFWPADLHLVGKEIIRFHTIIWPAILMALDLPLPKQIYGHGWLLMGDTKMSKSKGNVIDPVILVDKYGSDAIRYFLLREVPFGSDGSFSNEALINRINSDLANDLGNLVSRTVSMELKYFNGILPENIKTEPIDVEVKDMALELKAKVEEYTETLQFPVAISEIWKFVSRLNKYIDETTPWIVSKDPDSADRLAGIMYTLLESLRIVAILIEPFLPKTSPEILKQLGVPAGCDASGWESSGVWGLYKAGTKVEKGAVLFPRIDMEKELEELEEISKKAKEKAAEAAAEAQKKPETPEGIITIDDFKKTELKVAKVIDAQKVEGSDKLLRIRLSLGNEERYVVSGIAAYYSPEDVIGKKVVLVSNLKPARIKGIESRGMLLAASSQNGLSLITVDRDIPEGSTVS